jgi:hypothetical protein
VPFKATARSNLKERKMALSTPVQYIQVKDALGVQWLMNPEMQLKSKRPEDAKAFSAVEVQKVFKDLTCLGFKGLSIVDELPNDRKMTEATSETPDLKTLASGYFSHRKASDDAFRSNDGALSSGHAATASTFARAFMSAAGLPSMDSAVAEMRRNYRI